jgi:hypothetical protein
MKKLFVLAFLLLYLIPFRPAHAVTLVDKNGKELAWESYYVDGDKYCTQRGEGVICVPASDIVTIKKGKLLHRSESCGADTRRKSPGEAGGEKEQANCCSGRETQAAEKGLKAALAARRAAKNLSGPPVSSAYP